MEVLRDMVLGRSHNRGLLSGSLRTPLATDLKSASSGVDSACKTENFHHLVVSFLAITNIGRWVETYNKPKPWLPAPRRSRNLAAFSVISTSPWMKKFLSSSFFNWKNGSTAYGDHNELFEALQLVLSHLVLNPISPFALQIPTSRGDYDVAKVYLWNLPLKTIYSRAHEVKQPARISSNPPIVIFPKLTSRSLELEPQMNLDLNSLLHIRNFWRRQFTAKEEATYYHMAEALARVGQAPTRWDQALQEPLTLNTNWVGHYSCLHKWPRKMEEFEDKQSCAEDWPDHDIDPLVCTNLPELSVLISENTCFDTSPAALLYFGSGESSDC